MELNETNSSQNRGQITPKSCLKAYVNENFKAFFRQTAASDAAKLQLLDTWVMGSMDHRRVRRWLAGDGISCEGSNVRDREGEKSEKEERERKRRRWQVWRTFLQIFHPFRGKNKRQLHLNIFPLILIIIFLKIIIFVH